MLSADDLCCERDGRELFGGLCLDIKAGDLVELRGANGAGKSTLLRVLAGLFPSFSGTIVRRTEAIYMGHRGGVSPSLTAADNLRWLCSLEEVVPSGEDVAAALRDVGLAGYSDVSVDRMSAGQQRRTALARLVLTTRTLWLLDEPLTALDGAGIELVAGLLDRHCRAGGAALVATHSEIPAGITGRIEISG